MRKHDREVTFSSESDDWGTPPEVMRYLKARGFTFDLDPAATKQNKKAPRYISKARDGLKQPWFGNVFINPPWSKEKKVDPWIAKIYDEMFHEKRIDLCVALLKAKTDTAWFYHYASRAEEILFIKGRLKYVGAKWGATFPSMLVIWTRYTPVLGPSIRFVDLAEYR